MSEKHLNGFVCPLIQDWANYRNVLDNIEDKVSDQHTKIDAIHTHMSYAEKMVNELGLIRQSLTTIKSGLIETATGKNKIDTEVFIKLMITLSSVLGATILALIFVIVFLLTGESLGWLGELHK